MKKIKVFISYASDAEEEYNLIKKVIEKVTENYFREEGYLFTPSSWRDAIPGMGDPQEDKIDPLIIDSSIIIILLKNKLGTKRKDGKTGIEHEYDLAKRMKKEIMIFRCDFPIRPSQINPDQLKEVNNFISQVKNEALIVENIFSREDLEQTFEKKFIQLAKLIIKVPQDLEFKQHSRGF